MSSQLNRKRKLSNDFDTQDNKISNKDQSFINTYDEDQLNGSKTILKLSWNTRASAIDCLNVFPNLIDNQIKLNKEKFSKKLDQLVQVIIN